MIDLFTGETRQIAVLGAHCDDIALGMGGTLLTLARANPGMSVHALVLTGARTEREDEELSALPAFCPGASVSVSVLDLPDTRVQAHWGRTKNAVRRFREGCEPDIVFAPHRRDAHPDHRTLAELIPGEFRDHLVMGYEILKCDVDTPAPTVFHPLDDATAHDKVRLLEKHYPSQAFRDWWDEMAFLSMMRLRGVQCRHTYAEAFVVEKAAVLFGAPKEQRAGCSTAVPAGYRVSH